VMLGETSKVITFLKAYSFFILITRNHCALYDFLKYYIKDVFLAQISVDNGK